MYCEVIRAKLVLNRSNLFNYYASKFQEHKINQMKILKPLIGILALLLLFSCSDDDTSNTNPSLVDNWTLITATGTIAGTTHEFPAGTIVWKFNADNTIIVTNNNTNETLQSGLASGTYSYTVSEFDSQNNLCPRYITINADEFGCIILYDNNMNISQNVADGINYHFEKIIPFETD